MSGIFITYRRSDSIAWAGRLHDSLKKHFPGVEIFMDIEAIPPGTKFSEYIRDAVGSCSVLFVLIGPDWLTTADEGGERRLEDAEDFVALEIKAALDRDVPVIPTLVGDASMPLKQDLPEHLRSLCDFQNFVISDRSWHDDCARLAKHMQGIVGEQAPEPGSGTFRKVAIGGIVGIAAILVAVYFLNNNSVQPPPKKIKPKPPIVTTPPPVKPPEKKPETPVQPPAKKPEPPVVVARSLLEVGLEGRWEMVELIREGKKRNEKLAVELTRVGNNLEIFFKPSGPKMMLYNKTDQMRLITQDEQQNEQFIVNVKRYASDQEGNWRMSAVEYNKKSKAERAIFDGRIKISKDWHRFEGFITAKNNEHITMGMTINKGEKKCVATWGPEDKPTLMVATFHKM